MAIARALLKRPEVLILYDATGPLDPGEQAAILDTLLAEFADRTLIWGLDTQRLGAQVRSRAGHAQGMRGSSRVASPSSTTTAACSRSWWPPNDPERRMVMSEEGSSYEP